MKTIITILMACLVTIGFVVAAIALPNYVEPGQGIAIAIVFDSSMTSSSTWTQLNVLARQSISCLKAGDGLILISATTGAPLIKANLEIESPTSQNQQQLNTRLASINQLFLAKGDIAGALASAFDLLKSQPSASKSCLILTDGKHDNGQIQQIRRLAVAFKEMGWPLFITAAADANRRLFLAGSQGEMQVITLDNANLPQWLETVRPHAAPKPPEVTLPVTELPKPKPPKTVPVPDLTHPITKQTQIPDANAPAQTAPKPSVAEKPSTVAETATKTSGKTRAAPSKSFLKRIDRYQVMTILIMVVLIAFVLFATFSHHRKAEKSVINDSSFDDSAACHLKAEKDGQKYNLGELASIDELIFGSKTSSPVLLSGDNILPEEFKLINTRPGLKVKNLGDVVLRVNLMPLEPGKSTDVILPITVTSEKGFSIGLFFEPIEENNMEGEPEHGKE